MLIVFFSTDFILSEITDKLAYEDAVGNDKKWSEITGKFENNIQLTDDDYSEIFTQSGLGKPAVDKLLSDGRPDKIAEYRDYYLKDKKKIAYPVCIDRNGNIVGKYFKAHPQGCAFFVWF